MMPIAKAWAFIKVSRESEVCIMHDAKQDLFGNLFHLFQNLFYHCSNTVFV